MTGQDYWNKAYLAQFSQNERLYYVIGYLIWPFGLTLEAFRQWEKPWSKNAFWLFCIFFGFTFVIAEEGGADSDRYAREFVDFAHSGMRLKDLLGLFYVVGSDYTDIVAPLIMFFLSRITDNPTVLFVVFGLISGFFYSRNTWYVLERVNGKLKGIMLLFFITFLLINPIWNINGFRFSLAAQIFLFGTLPYLLEGKKKYLIWSGVSVLAHFTFILPVAILGMFVLLKNRTNIYLIFFIVTAFFREINLEWFESTLSFLPQVIFSEIANYMNEGYAEYRRETDEALPWFLTYSAMGMRWAIYLIIFSTMYFGKDVLKERSDLRTLLSFSLLFYGFVNIVSLIPSGDRFVIVANTFLIPYFMIFLVALPRIGESVLIRVITFPLLMLFCVVQLRIGMVFFGIMTLIGNPVTAVFYSDPVPLITQLKDLF